MNTVKKYLKALKTDERGNVIVFFAMAIVPMLMAIGIGVDATFIYLSQSKLQSALDASALAGSQAYYSGQYKYTQEREAASFETAQKFLKVNASDLLENGTVPTLEMTPIGDTALKFTATVPVKSTFTSFLGFEEYTLKANATVSTGVLIKTEVVLALDSTISMFSANRMVLMREAAKNFVDVMFNQVTDPSLMEISVVPWGTTVNIKTEKAKSPDLSDVTIDVQSAHGSQLVPNEPFSNRLTYIKHHETGMPFFTTSQVDAVFAPEGWRGCIVSADDEREVDKNGKVIDTFTDAPPATMRWPIMYLDYMVDSEPGETPACEPKNQDARPGRDNWWWPEDMPCSSNGTTIDGIRKACLSDPNAFEYLDEGGEACDWRKESEFLPFTKNVGLYGPQINCPTAMLPLSSNRAQVIEKLDHMFPVPPGTQPELGLMWALRALSPRTEWNTFWGKTTAQAPEDFHSPTVRKIVILLTDGASLAPARFQGYWGCTDNNRQHGLEPCWSPDSIEKFNTNVVNDLMLDTCETMKNTYGIELYTIATDITNNQALKLLEECATTSGHAYNISAAQLEIVFEQVAQKNVRIIE